MEGCPVAAEPRVSGDARPRVDYRVGFMATVRTVVPDATRTKVLLANRHACCVCQRIDVQIHHIDGDASNHEEGNLAVLCLPHHDKATAPRSLTARLKASEVTAYKHAWEAECSNESIRLARSRTAFFMVDYKNAERIRQLFVQLSASEYAHAYTLLEAQFREEDNWRKQQGFDVSIEPNTSWNPVVQRLLEYVGAGEVHPPCFRGCDVHPLDPLYARGFSETGAPVFAFYDVWCQIMVRAILAARGSYDIEDVMRMKDLSRLSLDGRLFSFFGALRGNVAFPNQYIQRPVSSTILTIRARGQIWKASLELKTHYVYSITAASCLSGGHSSGIFMMRGISQTQTKGKTRAVEFSCTPLILGSGGGGPLKIPKEPSLN